jgi:hypothetical protein
MSGFTSFGQAYPAVRTPARVGDQVPATSRRRPYRHLWRDTSGQLAIWFEATSTTPRIRLQQHARRRSIWGGR